MPSKHLGCRPPGTLDQYHQAEKKRKCKRHRQERENIGKYNCFSVTRWRRNLKIVTFCHRISFSFYLLTKIVVTITVNCPERICVFVVMNENDLVISAIKAVLCHPRHLLLWHGIHRFTPRTIAGRYQSRRRIIVTAICCTATVRGFDRGRTHINLRFFSADCLYHAATFFRKSPSTSMARILTSTAITKTVKYFAGTGESNENKQAL